MCRRITYICSASQNRKCFPSDINAARCAIPSIPSAIPLMIWIPLSASLSTSEASFSHHAATSSGHPPLPPTAFPPWHLPDKKRVHTAFPQVLKPFRIIVLSPDCHLNSPVHHFLIRFPPIPFFAYFLSGSPTLFL